MPSAGEHATVDVTRPNEIGRLAAGDILRRAANRTPEKPALIAPDQDEEVTYAELDARANRVAHALRDAGFEKGDRLAVVAGNSMQFLEAYFGQLKSGIVPVLINPEITIEDMGYEFDHAEVDGVLVDDVLHEKVSHVLEGRDIDVVAAYAWAGQDVPAPTLRAFAEGHDSTEPEVRIEDTDLAQIQFTSGTTSRPKGVLQTHKTLYTGAQNNTVDAEITRNEVLSSIMPLFHVAQLSMVKGTMHVSGTCVLRREYDPAALLDDIETHGVTMTFLLPMMYEAALNQDDIEERDLSSLELCAYGMAPIGDETLERCIETFGADFALGSGQTEAYTPTTMFQPEWQLEKSGNYWGQGTINTDVAIMDDDGNLLPQGEVGEIVYRGPNVMDGYLKDEEQTREAFAHGWFHSGDVGYFDEDHLLKFVDRKKDMIKSGGENVSTQKVESTLLDHPGVAQVGVVGLPHDRWDEAVTAFVVPGPDADVTAEGVEEFCRERLAGFETPKAVEVVEELPQTTTGKVQKFKLAQDNEEYYQ